VAWVGTPVVWVGTGAILGEGQNEAVLWQSTKVKEHQYRDNLAVVHRAGTLAMPSAVIHKKNHSFAPHWRILCRNRLQYRKYV
jgi:hypothetical protein